MQEKAIKAHEDEEKKKEEQEGEYKYIPCPLVRWDFYVDGSERSLILSLCSPHEKVIALTIMNEDTATALRDAINELLSGQIEE